MTDPAEYPARLEIDCPDGARDWLTVIFRPLAAIPIIIIVALLSGPAADARSHQHVFAAGGILWAPTMLMLVFRRKYPRWWFDWNLELTRFGTRVISYLALLRDEYPSTDQEQAIHLELAYPDAVSEPLAAADQMVLGDPAFHHTVGPGSGRSVQRCFGVVCDSLHWGLPALSVRLRGGCAPLVVPSCSLRISPHH